jgi:hypothetical protein
MAWPWLPGKTERVSGWVEQYRKSWKTKLDTLDDYLNELQIMESGIINAMLIVEQRAHRKYFSALHLAVF